MTIKFEPGLSYRTRSPGDSNCIIRVEIAKRTAHFVTTTEGKRFRVSLWDGAETIKPWGSYSMCPVLSARDVAAATNRPGDMAAEFAEEAGIDYATALVMCNMD